MTLAIPPTLPTSTRRALQPLWNALDDVAAALRTSSGPIGCVLAVSGGPDSRALLEAAARWPRRPANVVVVVVDHQRREGSRVEADAVVARATALGLAGVVATVDVGLPRSRSAEQELRRARYAALFEQARLHGASAVVTAHHRGDVAEGLLLHLAGRGGGREGRSPRAVEERAGIRLVRPFLDLDKATLRAALDALGQHEPITGVVVDDDDEAGRNARGLIRLKLLAPLRELRGDVEAALSRFARHRAEDDDVLDALVPADDVVDASLAPALLRRWLLRQVGKHGDDPRTSATAIDDVLALCARARVGAVDLKGCRAEVRHERGRGVVVVVTR